MVDIGHPRFEEHIVTVQETLQDIEALDKPTILVFNKIDAYRERYFDKLLDAETKAEIERELRQNLKNRFAHDNIFVSAMDKENLDVLRQMTVKLVKQAYQIRYPYEVKPW